MMADSPHVPRANGKPSDVTETLQAEAACLPALRALGYIAGVLEWHGVTDAMGLASPLSAATIDQPMELAVSVAAMVAELEAPGAPVAVQSGAGFVRMRGGPKGHLLVLDTGNAFVWACGGAPVEAALSFIGPLGSTARLRHGAGPRLEVLGGPAFKSYCRRLLRHQVDIEAMIREMASTPFYGDPDAGIAERPALAMLDRAVALAHERGIARPGPRLFTPDPVAVADPAGLRDHCLAAWRLASGQGDDDARPGA